jgi:DNA polymerase
MLPALHTEAGEAMMADDRAAAMAPLREEGLACTRCDLHLTGLPVVWGEGNLAAGVMFIGQGPGEQESKAGRPFVGPAGRLLDAALETAGIDRARLYLTNALKHWATTINERGTRVNRAPKVGELNACRLWWEGEVAIIQPRIVVCIGAPAAQAVIDKRFKITEQRGQWFTIMDGIDAIATLHPAYLLRLRSNDRAAYEAAWATVVGDLQAVAARAAERGITLAGD